VPCGDATSANDDCDDALADRIDSVHPTRQTARRVHAQPRGRQRQYASSAAARGPANNDARKFDYRRPAKPIIQHNFQRKTLRGGVLSAGRRAVVAQISGEESATTCGAVLADARKC